MVVIGLVAGIAVYATHGRKPSPETSSSQGASPDQPVTQAELLAQAYANGTIDRPTWLRYRVYSMFGVDALPAEYARGARTGDDMSLQAEFERGDPLPPDVRDELTAYLSRPTSKKSVFRGTGIAPASLGGRGKVTLAAAQPCTPTDWDSAEQQEPLPAGAPQDSSPGFKVWTRCTDGHADRLQKLQAIVDSIWQPMVGLMGPPLSDADPAIATIDGEEYGGGGEVDFYLIPRDVQSPRGGKISGLAGANAHIVGPKIGRRSSGYVLLDEAQLGSTEFLSTVVHEFFHVLGFAHNATATADLVGSNWVINWFVEASAVWAQSHFVSPLPPTVLGRFDGFQRTALPLDAHGLEGTPEFLHMYDSFIWLYFMAQELGPKAIADAWRAIEPADDSIQTLAYLDQVFPFHDHFQDFALRNLDLVGLKTAVGRVYQDLDPSFPITTPMYADDVPLPFDSSSAPASRTLTADFDHLTARYFRLDPDAGIKQVSFDLSGLHAKQCATCSPQYIRADVVVGSSRDGFQRVALSINQKQNVCINPSDTLYVVVSYDDYQGGAEGSLDATGLGDTCAPTSISSAAPDPWTAGVPLEVTGTGFSAVHSVAFQAFRTDAPLRILNPDQWNIVNDTTIDISVDVKGLLSPDMYSIYVSARGPQDPDAFKPGNAATCQSCVSILPS